MSVKGSNRTWLLIAGTAGGILLYDYVTKKLNTLDKLSATVASLQLGKLSFPQLEMLIGLTVTNGSSNNAVASSFTGNLVNNSGEVLGSFTVRFNGQQEIIIPANGVARVDVNVLANIASAAAAIITGKTIRIDGTVVIDRIPVPVNTDIQIGCACSQQ